MEAPLSRPYHGDPIIEKTVVLFVYGTLKRGHSRHAVLAAETYLGPARTRPLYRMHDCGGYPGLVAAPLGLALEGELWRVSLPTLAMLDEIEGVMIGLYTRKPIELASPGIDETVESYFYARDIRHFPDVGSRWGLSSSDEQ